MTNCKPTRLLNQERLHGI